MDEREVVIANYARHDHLFWLRYMWGGADSFVIGQHTREICAKIDKCIALYRKGISSFLIITIPFRHGKSVLVSEYLPPRFLGLFPACEVMLATYAASLSEDFSRKARGIMQTPTYSMAFPNVKVSSTSSAVDVWGIEGTNGGMRAVGLGGAITGKGYHLGIVDDYIKNREEAESLSLRNKRWESFTNDFLTRRAPVAITLVTATRWHSDDITGRIKKKMKEDSTFPQFEEVLFPAMSHKYPTGYLFPERFTKEWYLGQASALGAYGTASLLQGDPTTRGGSLFKVGF